MSSYSSVPHPFFARRHQGWLMSGGRKRRSRWRGWLARGLTLMAVGAVLVPGGATFGQSDKARAKIVLEGAGATFPAPLYKKWIGVFMSENPDIAVSYKEVGSGEGVRRFLAQSVDFGASDGALTDEQMAQVRNGARLVPATAGIVVLAYNLPGIGGDLRLCRCLSAKDHHVERPTNPGAEPDAPSAQPQYCGGRAPGRQRYDLRLGQSSCRDQPGLARGTRCWIPD